MAHQMLSSADTYGAYSARSYTSIRSTTTAKKKSASSHPKESANTTTTARIGNTMTAQNVSSKTKTNETKLSVKTKTCAAEIKALNDHKSTTMTFKELCADRKLLDLDTYAKGKVKEFNDSLEPVCLLDEVASEHCSEALELWEPYLSLKMMFVPSSSSTSTYKLFIVEFPSGPQQAVLHMFKRHIDKKFEELGVLTNLVRCRGTKDEKVENGTCLQGDGRYDLYTSQDLAHVTVLAIEVGWTQKLGPYNSSTSNKSLLVKTKKWIETSNENPFVVLLVKLYGSNHKIDQQPGMLVALIGKNGVRRVIRHGIIPANEDYLGMFRSLNVSLVGDEINLPDVEIDENTLDIDCADILGFGPANVSEQVALFNPDTIEDNPSQKWIVNKIRKALRSLQTSQDFGSVSIPLNEIYNYFLLDFDEWRKEKNE